MIKLNGSIEIDCHIHELYSKYLEVTALLGTVKIELICDDGWMWLDHDEEDDVLNWRDYFVKTIETDVIYKNKDSKRPRILVSDNGVGFVSPNSSKITMIVSNV
jgi:hypothetical protein